MSLLGKPYQLNTGSWIQGSVPRSPQGRMPSLTFVPGYPGKFVVLAPEGDVLAEVAFGKDVAVPEQQRTLKVLMQGWQALKGGGPGRERVLQDAGLAGGGPSASAHAPGQGRPG